VYKYLIAVALIGPLIGMWMVENGEYAGSVGVPGYGNGASIAYAIYAIAVAAIAWLYAVNRGRRVAVEVVPNRSTNALFRGFSSKLLLLEIAFLIVFLFGFGAINTWLGTVNKSELRTGLGVFGAIPSSMSKFIVPALVAYATMLYRRTSKTLLLKVLLAANFVVAFLIGASWGFKNTAISAVLPALLLLYWRVRPLQLITLAAVFVATLVVFFWIFDADPRVAVDVQTFLLTRFTVLQGDLAWYIWGMHTSGAVFPSYWPTLLAALGDKTLSILGVPRADWYEWMLFHYDWMITYLGGVPLDQIAGGHSLVATPFAEGLIAGGLGGVAIFAVLAGVLTGWMFTFLDRSLRQGRDLAAVLAATYFCYYLLPWLIAGAIVQLFHISLLVSFGSTVAILALMRRRWIIRARAPAGVDIEFANSKQLRAGIEPLASSS
jgi:hypothetical protein